MRDVLGAATALRTFATASLIQVRVGILLQAANASGDQDVAPGIYVDDVVFETGPVSFVSDDFEGGLGDWSVEGGSWALGEPAPGFGPSPLSGTQVFGTNLLGNYIDNNGDFSTRARLVSPELSVPAASENPRFKFAYWHELSTSDEGLMQISVDGGAWQSLGDDPIIGNSGGWAQRVVSLRPFEGHVVRVGILLQTANASGDQDVAAGLYLDNAAYETGPVTFASDDFEDGLGDWSVEGGVWALGEPADGFGPTPRSGSRLFGTNLSGDYIDNNGEFATKARLVSPEIEATVGSSFEFFVWHELNAGDSGQVQVSVEGAAWTNLGAAFTGNSADWLSLSVDLSPYAGEPVRLGVLLQTANSGGGNVDVAAGIYVDDALLNP